VPAESRHLGICELEKPFGSFVLFKEWQSVEAQEVVRAVSRNSRDSRDDAWRLSDVIYDSPHRPSAVMKSEEDSLLQ
jgi:hypothetical protein